MWKTLCFFMCLTFRKYPLPIDPLCMWAYHVFLLTMTFPPDNQFFFANSSDSRTNSSPVEVSMWSPPMFCKCFFVVNQHDPWKAISSSKRSSFLASARSHHFPPKRTEVSFLYGNGMNS